MTVKIYVDLRSQPCRALTMFLKNSEIPHEFVHIDLFKGEHKTPEHSARFPMMTVPAMEDGDYRLCETLAIFRYLTTKYAGKFEDKWYPAELKARSRVDEYLAFHHTGTRSPCMGVFVCEVFLPQPPPKERFEFELERLKTGLDNLERCFLKNDYVCGSEISFGDVMAVNELVQFCVSGRDITKGRPVLKAYIERVKGRLNPLFDEVCTTLYGWKVNNKKTEKSSCCVLL